MKIIVSNSNKNSNKRRLTMSNFGLILIKYFLFGSVSALSLERFE